MERFASIAWMELEQSNSEIGHQQKDGQQGYIRRVWPVSFSIKLAERILAQR
jgi:hypothetical protein